MSWVTLLLCPSAQASSVLCWLLWGARSVCEKLRRSATVATTLSPHDYWGLTGFLLLRVGVADALHTLQAAARRALAPMP